MIRSSPASRHRDSSRFSLVILVGLIALFLVATTGQSFLCDDAYITFRYAHNLAAGHGAVFNIGERVEGYTNLLWMLGLAGVAYLGGRPESWSTLVSTAASGTLLFFFWRHVQQRGGSPGGQHVLLLLFCGSAPFIVWTTGGLETALFTLLVFLAVASHISLSQGAGSSARACLLGCYLAAACVTRPEAIVLLPILSIAMWIRSRSGDVTPRQVLWHIAPGVMTVLGVTMWRLLYYGHWLPNTLAAKTSGYISAMQGLAYAGYFLLESSMWVPLSLIAVRLWKKPALRRDPDIVLPLIAALGIVGVIVVAGGDFMAMGRLLVPVVPLVLLALSRVLVSKDASRLHARSLFPALVCLYLVLNVYMLYRTNQVETAYKFDSIGTVQAYEQEWRDVAVLLRANSFPTDSVALTPVGVIPYHTNLYTVDLLALVAPDLSGYRRRPTATRVGHSLAIEPSHLLRLRPQFIIGHPKVAPIGNQSMPHATIDDSLDILATLYQPAAFRMPGSGDRQLNLWVRRDVVGRFPALRPSPGNPRL